MAKTLSREQLKEILMNKPSGVSNDEIIDGLRSRGYEFDGGATNPQPAEQVAEKPKSLLQRAGEFAVGGLAKMIPGVAGAQAVAQRQEPNIAQAQETVEEPQVTQTPQLQQPQGDPVRIQVLQRLHDEASDPIKKKRYADMIDEERGFSEPEVTLPTVAIDRFTKTETIQQDWIDRMQDRFMVRAANVSDILMETGTGTQTGVEGLFQVLGQGAGLYTDAVFNTAVSGFRALPDVVEKPLREAGKGIGEAVMASPIGTQAIPAVAREVSEFQQESPRAFRNVAATFNLVDAAATSTAIYKVSGKGPEALKKISATVNKGVKEVGKGVDDIFKFVWSGKDEVLEAKAKAAGYIQPAINKVDGVTGNAISNVKTRWVNNREAAKQLQQQLDEAGDIVRKATDQGLDFADANTIAHSTKSELNKLDEMATLAQKKLVGGRAIKEPDEIVGSLLRNKYDFIASKRDDVGKALGEIAKALPEERVAGARYNILNRIKEVPGLQNTQMKLVKGKHTLDFSLTSLADNLSDQKKVIEMFNKASVKSPAKMHFYRMTLRDQVAKQGLTKGKSTIDMATDAVRGGMLDTLDMADDAYRATSQQYAILSNAIDPLDKTLRAVGGAKGASTSVIDARFAQILRRLNSNSRASSMSMLETVDSIADTFGYVDDISIAHVQNLSDLVEKYFQSTRANTFTGSVTRGIEQVASGNLRGAAKGIAQELPVVKNLFPSPEATRGAFKDIINALIK